MSLWQWNLLSEVAISFFIKSISYHQIDDHTVSRGLIPLVSFLVCSTVHATVAEEQ